MSKAVRCIGCGEVFNPNAGPLTSGVRCPKCQIKKVDKDIAKAQG